VEVLLLHLLGQFEIEIRIAGFGLALDRDQLLGREPDRRMHHRVDVAYPGHGGRGLLVAQLFGVDLAPVRVIQLHLFHQSSFSLPLLILGEVAASIASGGRGLTSRTLNRENARDLSPTLSLYKEDVDKHKNRSALILHFGNPRSG
jgi:hypothetical protein